MRSENEAKERESQPFSRAAKVRRSRARAVAQRRRRASHLCYRPPDGESVTIPQTLLRASLATCCRVSPKLGRQSRRISRQREFRQKLASRCYFASAFAASSVAAASARRQSPRSQSTISPSDFVVELVEPRIVMRRKRRHAVVPLAVEPLAGRVRDEVDHPLPRHVAREIGAAPSSPAS